MFARVPEQLRPDERRVAMTQDHSRKLTVPHLEEQLRSIVGNQADGTRVIYPHQELEAAFNVVRENLVEGETLSETTFRRLFRLQTDDKVVFSTFKSFAEWAKDERHDATEPHKSFTRMDRLMRQNLSNLVEVSIEFADTVNTASDDNVFFLGRAGDGTVVGFSSLKISD
jgi:hypothetical protein